MKKPSKTKARILAVILAVLVVTGGMPFVAGTHVNDLMTPWREVPDDPTGVGLLDSAIDTASNVLDGVADHDQIKPLREEPQVPATFFHDIFDENDRIGGWGDWKEPDGHWELDDEAAGHRVERGYSVTDGSAIIDLDDVQVCNTVDGNQVCTPPASAAVNCVMVDGEEVCTPSLPPYDRDGIERGYRFGSSDAYPTDQQRTVQLQSPVISLRSLPQERPDEAPDQVPTTDGNTVDLTRLAADQRQRNGDSDNLLSAPALTQGAADFDRILLSIDHRYHFGCIDNNICDQGTVLVQPVGGNPTQMSSIRGVYQNEPTDNSLFLPFQNSFSGYQENFTEEVFDLSPFAGQDVRLIFQANVGNLDQTQYFTAPAFNQSAEFIGWDISNVRVEGPAWKHNVRLDRVLDPDPEDPSTLRNGDYITPAGVSEAVGILLLNRGQVTEDVEVTMSWEGESGVQGSCMERVDGLRPGDTQDVRFEGCLPVVENDEVYEVSFEAALAKTGHEDLYAHDNEMQITVRGVGKELAMTGGLDVDPKYGSTETPFSLTAMLRNTGLVADSADLALRIDWKHPDHLTFEETDETNVQEDWVDVNDIDSVTVEPGTAQQVTWEFLLPRAGLYRVNATATTSQGDQTSPTMIIGVFQTPDNHFDTEVDGFGEQAGWTTASMLSDEYMIPSECAPGDLEDCFVWELSGAETRKQPLIEEGDERGFGAKAGTFPREAPVDVGLRGEFEVDEQDRGMPVTHLEIEVQHHVLDLRCSTKQAGTDHPYLSPPDSRDDVYDLFTHPQPCDVPQGDLDTSRPSTMESPENFLSMNLVQGTVTIGGLEDNTQQPDSTPPPGDAADVNNLTLQFVGGSHYRNAYYNGQWITERFNVPLCDDSEDITDSLSPDSQDIIDSLNPTGCDLDGQVVAGLLAATALEFRMRGWQCPVTDEEEHDTSCPTWRVSSARAIATHSSDPDVEVELLEWDGADEAAQEHGSWYSYYHPPGNIYYIRPAPNTAAGQTSVSIQTGAEGFCIPVVDGALDLDQVEEQRLRCPSWERRSLEGLAAASGSSWRMEGDSWTNALEPDADGRTFYDDIGTDGHGTMDLLMSRVLSAPETGSAELQFDHQYQFHPYYDPNGFIASPWENEWRNVLGISPSFSDSGMLMVRFFAEEEPEEPQTPWLPVDTSGRFMGTDCGIASVGGCSPGMDERNPQQVSIPLQNFPVRDYRALNGMGDRNGELPGTLDLQRDCTAEGLPINGVSGDDERRPCNVQFAFRLEVPEPDTGVRNLSEVKDGMRDQLRQHGAEHTWDAKEGWFVDAFRITAAQVSDFDLMLDPEGDDVRVETAASDGGPSYEWTELGLGPGTEAFANLTVTSNGLFSVDAAMITVTVYDADNLTRNYTAGVYESEDLILLQGQISQFDVPFHLNDWEGDHHIVFEVELLGDLMENVPLVDRDRTNNCIALKPDGGFRPMASCAPSQAPRIPIVSNPALDLDLDVTPLIGRSGTEFFRTVDLTIRNEGNVIVENATVTIERAGGGDLKEWRYILERSPEPTKQARWGSGGAPLLDMEGSPTNPLNRLFLEEPDIYFVSAILRSPPDPDAGIGDGEEWVTDAQVRLDAFSTIYSDTFDTGGIRMDRLSMVDEGGTVQTFEEEGEGWSLIDGTGSDGRPDRTRMWIFGDPETGRYPDDADASIYLPSVDAASARRATFTLNHNYDLERGYDGARVEACIGTTPVCQSDNATWHVLEPRDGTGQGYPATVTAASSLNPENDPRHGQESSAFTASSTARVADGWVADEFELAQLPGFSSEVVLEELLLDGDWRGPHEGEVDDISWAGPRTSYNVDWRSSPTHECPDDCWLRENLNRVQPRHLDGSEGYWWSGSAGSLDLLSKEDLDFGEQNDARNPATTLVVEFDFSDVIDNLDAEKGERVRIAFSAWKDESGDFEATLFGTGASTPPHQALNHGAATSDWQRFDFGTLNLVDETDYTLQFEYADELLSGSGGSKETTDLPNRGAAFDDVSLEFFTQDSSGVKILRTQPLLKGGEVDHELVKNITIDQDIHDGIKEDIEDDLVWRSVDEADATPEAWGLKMVDETRQGNEGPVWRFGMDVVDPDSGDVSVTYPVNARERLLTPRIDLGGVSGVNASFEYSERYDLMEDDERCVWIQVIETGPGGEERVGDWQTQDEWCSTEPKSDQGGGDAQWLQRELDISEFRGQTVRFAFEITTTRILEEDEDEIDDWHWAIDGVRVRADALVGDPVQIRMRAATDASINHGHWMIESVQFVGDLYDHNVALVPGESRDRVRPGGSLTFEGEVRNLGPSSVDGIRLDATSISNGADGPTIRFLTDRNGNSVDPIEGPLEPIELLRFGETDALGNPMDRIPYKIEVDFENEKQGDDFSFHIGLTDQGAPLGDQNAGDDALELEVEVTSTRWDVDDVGFSIHPPTVDVDANETARFLLDFENTGGFDVDADVRLTAECIWGECLERPNRTIEEGRIEDLMPGQARLYEWEWTPEEADRGFYRITLNITDDPLSPRLIHDHLLVGHKPIWGVQESPPQGWSTATDQDTPCQMTPASNCWRASTQQGFFDRGGQSAFIGNEAGGGYGEANAMATWPGVELGHLAQRVQGGQQDDEEDKDIREGSSPFSPFLNLRYLAMLHEEDDVSVLGRSNGEFEGLITQDLQSGRTGVEGLTGRHDSLWRSASFPLFDNNNGVVGAGDPLLTGGDIDFQFNADWMQRDDGRGFAIDSVSVSSYDVAVSPSRHEEELRPGSNKTYYFHIENTGAARDTYDITINHRLTDSSFGDHATVTLLEPEIAIEPGESSRIAVRVEVPLEANVDPDGDIVLEVASREEPNRVDTVTVETEFVQDEHPNFVTDIRRPGDEAGEPVGEGEEATFIVTVTNDGRSASRPTDLVVFACPADIGVRGCGESEQAIELGDASLPRLISSWDVGPDSRDHLSTQTFSWIPEVGHEGDYRIIAVADPEQRVTQFDRASAVATHDLTVLPIERPDLHVRDLKVTNVHGEPVTSAFAGDNLHIEGVLENMGNTVARDTTARIVNQFILREDRIGDLHPGETRTLSAQWEAQPGNWVVQIEASTSDVEIDDGHPNAERWSLAIRSGVLEADWTPDVLHLDPGESLDSTLNLHNRRDQVADLDLFLRTDDITVQGVPSTLELARGEGRDTPVELTASPFAETGRHRVTLELVEQNTGNLLATASLDVHVSAERDLSLVREPLVTAPGTARLPLTFVNGGSAPESFTARLQTPDDWTTTILPPTLRVDPGSERTALAVLEIPAGTPAGRYPLTLEAGDELQETINVDVIRQPVWRSEVSGVHSLSDRAEVIVRVENVGNAPATPPFRTESSETTYTVRPTPTMHAPGEMNTYRIDLQTANATALLLLPGQEDPEAVSLLPERPPVAAVGLDVRRAGTVSAGEAVDLRFSLRSQGSQTEHGLPVRLWVDGIMAGQQRIVLDAGEEQDVDFRWEAMQAGARVVTATVGSGDNAVARTIVLNVGPGEDRFGIPGPGVPLLLALLIPAALVVWWRRQRP